MGLARKISEAFPNPVRAGLRARKAFRMWNLDRKARKGIPMEDLEVENKDFLTNIVTGLLRHALTFGGGAAVFTDEQLVVLGGAVATVLGVVWSGIRKWKRSKAVA